MDNIKHPVKTCNKYDGDFKRQEKHKAVLLRGEQKEMEKEKAQKQEKPAESRMVLKQKPLKLSTPGQSGRKGCSETESI